MFKFIVDWFGKKPHPNAEAPAVKPEAAPYKVEAPVQVAPTVAPAQVAPATPKAPAKKRTFVKRQEGGTAKVAKIKAPVKTKAPTKPKAKK